MTKRSMIPLRAAAVLALAAPLAGCISLGPKPPETLIRLTAAQHAPADAGAPLDPARALIVMMPSAPAETTVTRVPVRSGAANLSYLKDAQYADAPPKLFRDLLLDVIRARTGRDTLEMRDSRYAAAPRLGGRIDTFAVDAPGRKVDLVFDALLVTPQAAPGAEPKVTARRFEAHVPVSAVDAANVSPALAQAANDVAVQIADWVGR